MKGQHQNPLSTFFEDLSLNTFISGLGSGEGGSEHITQKRERAIPVARAPSLNPPIYRLLFGTEKSVSVFTKILSNQRCTF